MVYNPPDELDPPVLIELAFATALVMTTVLVHTACTAIVIAWMRSPLGQRWTLTHPVGRFASIGALVLGMSFVGFLESLTWAGLYLGVGAISDPNEAIYFALVTFTTLGYGDVTLAEEWRVLGAFESANGIIMFGWTTALVVAVLQRILSQPTRDSEAP
jgi:voltage-gated potassium channel Kch